HVLVELSIHDCTTCLQRPAEDDERDNLACVITLLSWPNLLLVKLQNALNSKCMTTAAPTETSSAIGIATAPILRKSQKLTSSFSLRSAIYQRIVANEPVTERFGPRSTPINTALAINPLA